jgi:hypothetical protein
MDCIDIAAMMDEDSSRLRSTIERHAVEKHLARCESCALAWQGHTALLGMRVPSASPSFLEGMLHRAAAGHADGRFALWRRKLREV